MRREKLETNKEVEGKTELDISFNVSLKSDKIEITYSRFRDLFLNILGLIKDDNFIVDYYSEDKTLPTYLYVAENDMPIGRVYLHSYKMRNNTILDNPVQISKLKIRNESKRPIHVFISMETEESK